MTEIPYDEMRRILGLPDVKREVELVRLQRAARELGPQLAAIFNRFASELTIAVETIQPALHHLAISIRPQSSAPMWAIDETRTHRGRRR